MQMAKLNLTFIKAHNMQIFRSQAPGAQGVVGLMLVAFGRWKRDSFYSQSFPKKVVSFDFQLNCSDCYESSSPCVSFLYFNQGCQQLSKEHVFYHSLAFSGPRAQVFFRNYRSLYLSKGILKMTRWRDSPTCPNVIGHFRVHLSLRFKARLSATSLLWKSVFIHIEIGINYPNRNFALRLALKERLRETCLLYTSPSPRDA